MKQEILNKKIMKAYLFFNTKKTIEKQAYIIMSDDKDFAIRGKECEIIYMSDLPSDMRKHKIKDKRFMLVKYKNLYLSGYLNSGDEKRYDFNMSVINFDEVFKPAKQMFFKLEEKYTGMYAHLPEEVSCDFDLANVYDEMISDCYVSIVKEGEVEKEILEMGDFE